MLWNQHAAIMAILVPKQIIYVKDGTTGFNSQKWVPEFGILSIRGKGNRGKIFGKKSVGKIVYSGNWLGAFLDVNLFRSLGNDFHFNYYAFIVVRRIRMKKKRRRNRNILALQLCKKLISQPWHLPISSTTSVAVHLRKIEIFCSVFSDTSWKKKKKHFYYIFFPRVTIYYVQEFCFGSK